MEEIKYVFSNFNDNDKLHFHILPSMIIWSQFNMYDIKVKTSLSWSQHEDQNIFHSMRTKIYFLVNNSLLIWENEVLNINFNIAWKHKLFSAAIKMWEQNADIWHFFLNTNLFLVNVSCWNIQWRTEFWNK